MAQRRRTREQWQALVAGWPRSGLTQAQYCARHGISLSSFQYWRARLRKAAKDLASERRSDPAASVRLLPVELSREPRSAAQEAPLTLVLSNGLRLEVTAGFDAVTLRQLLAVLQMGEAA